MIGICNKCGNHKWDKIIKDGKSNQKEISELEINEIRNTIGEALKSEGQQPTLEDGIKNE